MTCELIGGTNPAVGQKRGILLKLILCPKQFSSIMLIGLLRHQSNEHDWETEGGIKCCKDSYEFFAASCGSSKTR